ncbi:MAG: universal stress protein [Candidatus Korobacteraceae bacterium]|jgi:nucleotide-binding universal stress UspA family protein
MTTSLRPKTIVFATDFLESSRLALDFAVAFAHHYQAKLLILHVFHMPQAAAEVEVLHEGPSMSRRSRETRLEAFAAGVRRAGVDVEWRLVEGWMPEALLEKVQEIKPDLLVLGTHGVYRGLGHILIGSNAEEMLLTAPCPTLTVGRHVPAGIGLDASFEHVLYITDFTPESAAAAPYAVGLSHDFHARLEVCHLLSEHGDKSDEAQHRREEQYCDAVRRKLPNGEASWCSPGAQLEHGVKASEILQRARGDTAGLIVLGVKGESQFARHLHTSLAFQLVATAACPVFAICG